MTSESLSRIGRISLNINGDFEDEVLVEKARKAERYVDVVWIGESDFFKSPFHVAELFLDSTDLIVGFGILRAGRCESIIRGLRNLERYGDRIIVGISAGDGGRVSTAVDCIKKVKERFDLPVLGGGTGKGSISAISRVADGMLLNHVSPEHVRWAVRHSTSHFNAAYGPALSLPSEYEQDLILATALVMGSSRGFLSEMGYDEIFDELRTVNLMDLIERRQKGENLNADADFEKLLEYRDFLLERFSVAGSTEQISEKISQLLKICDHVVLGDPFFRDGDFDRKLAEILKILKKRI